MEGEAGVGKSRLAWEFEKYIDGLSYTVRWHRGRCLAYGEGVAFWALAEAVRGRLGLVEIDLSPVVAEQLDAGLSRFVPDPDEQAWLRPRLLALTGGGAAASFAREELFTAWTVFFERVGEGTSPVMLVVDDAQHADEGFLAFLDHLLASARFPVFVVALTRPGLIERRPALATNRRSSVLRLGPLGEGDMAALLDGLVGGLPAAARAAMVDRADGVPLFAVETVRALIDRNLVVPREGRYVLADPDHLDVADIAAPASLHALVAARLDALSPAERRVVADASVLGAAFTRVAISTLASDVPDLAAVLDSLVRLQILAVQADRFSAEFGQFRFEQAVVRQVAYDTLSRRDRKSRHLAVAAYYLEQPDSGDDLAPLIAQHHLDALGASAATDGDQAELTARAIGWLERSAARARRLGSPEEGFRHLQTALEHAGDAATRARLQEAAARCGIDAGAYDEAVEYGHAAMKGYEALGDEVGAGRAAAAYGAALVQGRGDLTTALPVLEPHWASLQRRDDATSALLPLASVLSIAYRQNGRHRDAQALVDARIRLAQAGGEMDDLADALNELGVGYLQTGAPFVGKVVLRSAAELARQRGLPTALARALNNLGTEAIASDAVEAIQVQTEAVTAARQSGASSWISLTAANLSLAHWTRGSWSEIDALLAEPAIAGDPIAVAISASVSAWLAAVRGAAVPPTVVVSTADLRSTEDENGLGWAAHLDQLAARDRGDLAAAARFGLEAVEHVYKFSGSSDDFLLLWPAAVEVALEAGDLDLVHRLLAFADATPVGLVSPSLRAHRDRLAALVGRASGADAAEVEARMRAAVTGFDAFGAAPMRARSEETLGWWLVQDGRAPEAEPLLDRARATYAELGATQWLIGLDAGRTQSAGRSSPR